MAYGPRVIVYFVCLNAQLSSHLVLCLRCHFRTFTLRCPDGEESEYDGLKACSIGVMLGAKTSIGDNRSGSVLLLNIFLLLRVDRQSFFIYGVPSARLKVVNAGLGGVTLKASCLQPF